MGPKKTQLVIIKSDLGMRLIATRAFTINIRKLFLSDPDPENAEADISISMEVLQNILPKISGILLSND